METEWIGNLVAWASLVVTVAIYLASAIVLRRLQRAFEGRLEPRLVHSIEAGETELDTEAARRERGFTSS